MYIRLWEKFKGWRRGEKMIPGVNRGRCFIKEDKESGIIQCKAQPKVSLVGIKVIRANGEIEEIQ